MPTKYVLPELEYSYDALEPHVSRRILELHHKQHHAGYVKKANEITQKMDEARKAGDLQLVAKLEPGLAFNASGHLMHSLFWRCLSPKGGGEAKGALADQIKNDFGSFDIFKKELNTIAESIMGSGWATLAWDPVAAGLRVVSVLNHEHKAITQSVPLLVVDAWEHAYYLQYENKKADFFAALWNVFDWSAIGARFEAAKNVRAGV